MAEQSQTPDDLCPFAEALVRQLVAKKQLAWDEQRREDAVQELFLAGWQVWRDHGDVGLAKNRMASRQKNLLRDYASERRHEPPHQSSFPEPVEGTPDYLERDRRRTALHGDLAGEALVSDFLASLPERQRQIVQLRMAGCTGREIADELGISLRTVERELSLIRKDYQDDDGS